MATETQTQKSEDVDNKTSGSVTDFLVAPKKKRKNYVILAFGDSFDPEVAKTVESHIRSQYPQLAIAIPMNSSELSRLTAKLISLLIIFDEFHGSIDKTLDTIFAIKKKKSADGVPTLFVTHDEERLVDKYHQKLLPFHEVDEFVSIRNLQLPILFMRIRSALRGTAKRRSRRFEFDIPVTYYDLNTSKILNGEIKDLSLHGALVHSADGNVFSVGDQIRINLNVARIQKTNEGEFLRISARVRRLYISGDLVGVSFEFLNERQILVLTKFISHHMNKQMSVKRATIHIPKKVEERRSSPSKSNAG